MAYQNMLSKLMYLISILCLSFLLHSQALAAKEHGNAAYKAKKFEEALAHYNKAIEVQPDNIVFYNNKSGTFYISIYYLFGQ